MNKKMGVLSVLLIASTIIMACSLSQTGTDIPAALEEQVATLVPTEEPTPVSDMDISNLVLSSADFPDVAFSDVSLADMGMSEADLSSEDFTVESFFSLLESQNFEMVMGFTTLLQSPLDRVGFDLVLNQPGTLVESFLGGMGDVSRSETQELPEFMDTVGDSSAGMTVLSNMEGMGMRLDVVVFRRGSIGSFIVTMYLDGQQPPVSLMKVSQKFDEKIVTFLANQ